MGQVSPILRDWEGNGRNGFNFWCPGCNNVHSVHVSEGGWDYNGNPEAPTFSPSILLASGHYDRDHKPGDACWCTYNAEKIAKGEEPSGFSCTVCHSFVRDGILEFLSDSTHSLAGKSVPLPEWPKDRL